jgi:hypothetical protein
MDWSGNTTRSFWVPGKFWWCCGGYDYHITHEEKASLTKAITKEEVYKALISMKSYKLRVRTDSSLPSSKSSGMKWGMMFGNRSNDHWEWEIWPWCYSTRIVLIQKGDHPSSFDDFIPKSLCNIIYKLVSKVLVVRHRPILAHILSP